MSFWKTLFRATPQTPATPARPPAQSSPSNPEFSLTPIPAGEKARLARTWEQNADMHAPNDISDLFAYAVRVFRSKPETPEWDKVSSFAYLWSEYLIRTYGWEWMHCSGKDSTVLAILSKDKKNLIIVDVLCMAVVQGEAPPSVLKTLYQQIVNKQPLQKMQGVMNMNIG